MVHRRDELRASKVMQDRALNHPNIEMVWDSVVEEVLGDGDRVTGLRLKDTVSGSERQLDVNGMFVAIGHTPNTSFLSGKLDMNDKGYIRWTKSFRTNTRRRWWSLRQAMLLTITTVKLSLRPARLHGRTGRRALPSGTRPLGQMVGKAAHCVQTQRFVSDSDLLTIGFINGQDTTHVRE